jgi:septum formation protein
MKNHSTTLTLGSSSIYRQQLLSRLGIPFQIAIPNIDETPHQHENALALTKRLATEKAQAIAAQGIGGWIIGADQVAVCDNEIIGKPGGYEKALIQLTKMQGKEITFHSAICVLNTAASQSATSVVPTHVKFRNLPQHYLEAYLNIEQPYDCAGSAKAEGLGILLTEYIKSEDATAIIGLPLIELSNLLLKTGFPLLTTALIDRKKTI